jgi:hypothetical protein
MQLAGFAPPEPEDESDRQLLADVRQYGWHCVLIEDDPSGPQFCFTVGFYASRRHPEVILFGLDAKRAHGLLWCIWRAIDDGRQFEPYGVYDDIAESASLAFVPVRKKYYREYLGYVRWFYRSDDVPVFQCVWPDKEGNFPWQPGYDKTFEDFQPILSGK